MRTLQVHFPSGKEVLGRYWGMLCGGGLTLDLGDGDRGEVGPPDAPRRGAREHSGPHLIGVRVGAGVRGDTDCERGERVQLEVHVRTIKKTFRIVAEVLDIRRVAGVLRATFGFVPDPSPDELLDAVWADGLDVPQRRSRRFPLHAAVRYDCLSGRGARAGQVGRLVNLSQGGCCIAGKGLPPRDTQVLLFITVPRELRHRATREREHEVSIVVAGRVRWTERCEDGMMGIEFLSSNSRSGPQINDLISALDQQSS